MFFRGTPDRTMCPEIDSASESEYQGKGGRCVWLTTYHPCSAETSKKSGALNYPEPLWPPWPVAGDLCLTLLCLTYLLTSWSRVLLEKLTGSAPSQEIPHIFGTRRFITVLTSARHLSLSSANSIQSSQPPPTS